MTSEFVKVTDKIYYFSGEQETDRPFLYYIKGHEYSVAIDDFPDNKDGVNNYLDELENNALE